MHNDIAKIHYQPAVAGQPLSFASLMVIGTHIIQYSIGECIQHTVAGPVADDKIIGKGNHVFYINKNNILSLSVFKGVYDFTCKFECVQNLPL